ncbi:hypothetical protein PAHAL_1G277500 [Panicum hallii]|jgi:hypothetical protein|uniref:C2H2-type domain-containing protein n=1 Tax=Panicum hallii TaxID=206008 RepID=A0A2S3GQ73_9POAL|nr:protein SENSITIVE TO PROTON RHIZOTOXICITY 1-like [Panicum hallii]PAN06630.1 hypothetical protein PAHAL_1G277500 [Panicum hallii]
MDSTPGNPVAGAAGSRSSAIASRGATAPPPLTMPGGEPSDALLGAGAGGAGGADGDPRVALLRLAALGDRMAAVRGRIAASISGEARPLSYADIQSVSSEISSAAQLVVLNAASLLASSVPFPAPPPPPTAAAPSPAPVREIPATAASAQEQRQEAAKGDGGYEVMELDAAELLAEHVHFCEICGKGFRRDANLRMHMRAHGDRFKTLDALSRPGQGKPKPPARDREVRFSCPFAGCNRNRAHRRFRPLKSAVCARNHFRRSHCPKLYACERCDGKKRFAVLADLRSHLRHCGEEAQWRCSCGTTFSRKDKLFGHLALFEGHTPAVTEPNKNVAAGPTEPILDAMEEGGIEEGNCDQEEDEEGGYDPEFFKEWMEELKDGASGSSWPGPAATGH